MAPTDSTITDAQGNCTFNLQFIDGKPPVYYESIISRPNFLDYTTTIRINEFQQFDTITIGRATRLELDITFDKIAQIYFTILGYDSLESLNKDTPEIQRNFIGFSHFGIASNTSSPFLSKTLPWKKFQYIVIKGTDFSNWPDQPSSTIVWEKIQMPEGGLLKRKIHIDD